MSMMRILLRAMALAVFLPAMLLADSGGGGISGLGLLFNGLILILVVACFLIAMKIFAMLRGGEMASGWQVLAIGFIILCLGQLVELASTLELFALDRAFIGVVRLAGVFTLLLGIMRIKKVLS